MNIIKRHGFVPDKVMPMSADAADPGVYVNRLQTLLAKAQRDFTTIKRGPGAGLKRSAMLSSYERQVDQLLTTAIGKPPREFQYEGKRYTPRTFASRYLGLQPQDLDYVTLTNYTNHGAYRRYRSGVSPGMNAFEEYNVPMEVIQRAVKRTVRQGEAVLFGINVDESHPHRVNADDGPDKAKGILSAKAFNYNLLIPDTKVSKRVQLQAGLNPANHAMAITGYDPGGKKRGAVRKWKVENSHGKDTGDHGYFHMYDDFFRQNVEDVVVPRANVPKSVLRRLERKPVLEAGD